MTALVDITPAGDHAVLVQLDPAISAAELHARAAAMRAENGVLACIVGHSSLYVVFERGGQAPRLSGQAGAPVLHFTFHRIPVAFDGPDLDEFLGHTKQTRDPFLKRVAGLRLVVRYLGFRGGFAYLDGWPAEWAMPRRPTSRPVKRGAFAIAGAVAGFYPLDSPGGWNVLGHTDEDVAYRFAPGDEIAIVEGVVPASGQPEGRRDGGTTRFSAPFMTNIEPANWSNLEHGKPVGGPFDPDLASALAGEIYEFAQIGPKIASGNYIWADLNGTRRIEAPAEIGRITNGFRGYLATEQTEDRGPRNEDRLTIGVQAGPHDIGIRELECTVTPQLDRIGTRLTPARRLHAPADMPSVGMQFGTLQLHSDGSIVAMGPEHPVTGGYLQPMTVLWNERWKLAHLAPGERVRFVTY
ncbi:MAG TPA: carboxyltransferase domain-containing protein [Thermoanaerobaculia bacterium]|nr:carboxyltransferase domain-containing protein [Thermoanaerobaculia bacterium]